MSTPHSKTRTDRDDLEQIADALAEALNHVTDVVRVFLDAVVEGSL